jgi:hypothetical protein
LLIQNREDGVIVSENSALTAAFIAAIITMSWVSFLISYVIGALIYYRFAKKIGMEKTWIAVIPIVQWDIFFKAIHRNFAWILIFLIPVVNIVFAILFYIKFFQVVGRNPLMLLWLLLPVAGPLILLIYLLYMAFSSEVKYVG